MRWFVFTTLTLFAWPQDKPEEIVKKLYPQATAIKAAGIELSPQSLERLRRALGEEPKVGGTYYAFTAELFLPRRDQFKLRMMIVTAGTVRLAVTVIPEEATVANVHVLDHREKTDLSRSPLLTQLFAFKFSREALYRPASELEARLKKAAEARDDEGRSLRALVAVKRLMRTVGATYDQVSTAVSKKKPEGTEAARKMTRAFEDMLGVMDGLGFLGDTRRFTQAAEQARDESAALTRALGESNFELAAKVLGGLSRSTCSGCHGSYQDTLRSHREELGIGDGYFALDFDVGADPALDAGFQAELLKAIRTAVLILVETK